MIRFEQADDGQITLITDNDDLPEILIGEPDTPGPWRPDGRSTVGADGLTRLPVPDSPAERDGWVDALIHVDRDAAAALEALL